MLKPRSQHRTNPDPILRKEQKMAKEYTLPGFPKKSRVRDVKRALATWGIRPTEKKLWILTWKWAHKIEISYVYPRWPLASEIAAQYVLLLMVEMNKQARLRLPHRAAEKIPEEVQMMLIPHQSHAQIENKMQGLLEFDFE